MVSRPMGSNQTLYDRDFYAWANEQAMLLREGKLAEADIPNIAEEIESMGRGEKRELVNGLAVLLLHLLKWKHQPMRQSKSWQLTTKEQRLRLKSHLNDNPSLKPHLDDALAEAFEIALVKVQAETGFEAESFPARCPWPLAKVIDQEWLPD
jgi:hypothetical protein